MRELRFHATGDDFLRAVEPTLIRHEARHSLAYGLARRFAEDGYAPGNAGDPEQRTGGEAKRVEEGHLLTVWNGDQLDLGAWHTPPHAFCVTGGSQEGLAAVATWMAKLETPPTELNGPSAAVGIVAAQLGASAEDVMGTALFELTQVNPPKEPPRITVHSASSEDEADVQLATDWAHRFAVDCGLDAQLPAASHIQGHVRAGSVYLARNGEGEPTCMVAVTRTTPRTANISFVYTPPLWRGRGYASALVADVSQRLLDAGKESCTLFTDLANPTSNKIYQAIGYERIETFRWVRLGW